MPTVGQITDKISELRSKIAVTEGVVLYLKTNYMEGPEQGLPEMFFTRAGDYGRVTTAHINLVIADYVDYLDTLKMELDKWENLTVQMPSAEPPPVMNQDLSASETKTEAKTNGNGQHPTEPVIQTFEDRHPPAPKAPPPTRKEASSGAKSRHPNQSTPR